MTNSWLAIELSQRSLCGKLEFTIFVFMMWRPASPFLARVTWSEPDRNMYLNHAVIRIDIDENIVSEYEIRF